MLATKVGRELIPIPKELAAMVLVFILLTSLQMLPESVGSSTSTLIKIISTAATPIEHLVIIFNENRSFDHYFARYPHALNPPGEPRFTPSHIIPSINGLAISSALMTDNPNLVNPFRLNRTQVLSCSQNHTYTGLQEAYNGGLLDKFVRYADPIQNDPSSKSYCDPTLAMGYYDGNTVTALWNYAQRFAMSDNFYTSTFGSSLPGHINLISGQTHGAGSQENIPGKIINGTIIGNANPVYDDCSRGDALTNMLGKNVGDLLNDKNITWGWFQGGFKPSIYTNSSDGNNIKAICDTVHRNIAGKNITDYISYLNPFQFYSSTANPHHLPPTSVEMIGHTDQANHQYDLSDFWNAAESGNLPAVSFIKPASYQNGHPDTSGPLDEQAFLVNAINRLQQLKEWKNMAIIITYDESGGWYDHVMPPIVSQSNDPLHDRLLGLNHLCGKALAGNYQDRCGYGPRLPFLIISPWSKVNFVDHEITDQSSILRFIEDNWDIGRIGDQSLDVKAGSLGNMFDFTLNPRMGKLLLTQGSGTVIKGR